MESRRRLVLFFSVLFLGNIHSQSYGQIAAFPYVESFDSTSPPLLPSGWTSTQNRTQGIDDFTTAASTARSLPNAVLSTNATIEQSLISPNLNFSGLVPDRIVFYTRRSSTHLARVVLEASLDGGSTYTLQIGDSLTNPGTTSYVQASLALPSVLAGVSTTRFRWRIVPDASGTTGTFRIDDLIITVRRSHDLAATGIQVMPTSPVEGDSLLCIAIVRNLGELTAPAFGVDFFVDANSDSLPQAVELAASILHSQPLGVAESTMVATPLTPWPPGQRLVMTKIVYGADQDTTNNLQKAPVTIGYRSSSVVVNEVMYAPSAPEPEWVELYNTRDDSINLRGWLISDNTSTSRRMISATSLFIRRGGYVVLTRDSAAFMDVHPQIFSRVIAVPNMPAFNNSGDAVTLYDDRVAVMDSVQYLPSWGGSAGGFSLERKDPIGPSGGQSNWGSSRHALRSTPGVRNSITRNDHDLRVDSLFVLSVSPVAGDTVVVMVEVSNPGIEAAGPFGVSLFHDANNDSVGQPSELIGSVNQPTPLQPLDSIVCSFQIPSVRVGSLSLIGVAAYQVDEDSTNNILHKVFVVGYPVGGVLINEIMYAPPSGVPEWVELANVSSDTIDLKLWRIGNRAMNSRYTVSQSAILLPPGGHAVVAKDTALLRSAYPDFPGQSVQVIALPTFLWNNGGDAAVLQDNRGSIMDSLFYQPAWGGAGGASLERRDLRDPSNDSTNWATSEDSLRATPGRANSVVTVDHDLEVVRANAERALPGSSAQISITVRNRGRLNSTQFALLLYHDRNRDSVAAPNELIRRMDITQQLARRETLVASLEWPNPPPGDNASLALVEYSLDLRPSNNRMVTSVRVGYPEHSVVINEIMFSPLTENAEYIELLNNSAIDVDMKDWNVLDRPTTSGGQNAFSVSSTSKMLHPGELFVLASDSTIFALFPYLLDNPRLVGVADVSSLGLNNDADDVLVQDLIGTTIDSVAYTSAWHNPAVFSLTGRSLERINPSLGASDGRSWSTCTLPIGGTPGKVNSIYASVLPSTTSLSFSPNPFSPDGDGREDFTIIHFETPVTVATMSIKIYDVRGRLIRRLVNNEPGSSQGYVVWDGRNNEQQKARIGMYVVLLEALNAGGGVLETAKGVVVLAGKLD